MNLIDLKAFVSVVEEGSATAAAHQLHMTQPGITKHIQNLEEELGRPLFDRIKKRLVLNTFGHGILKRAKGILSDVDKLANIADQKIMPTGVLKIGLTDAATQTIIPPKMKELHDTYPGLRFELTVSDSEHIEEGVLRGRYDIGIILGTGEPHGLLREHVIDHDRVDGLVAKDHPLGKLKVATLEELAKYPLMLYPRGSRTRHIIDETFRRRGMVPEEIIDVHFNTAAVRLAEAGLGVALLSVFFIEKEMLKGRLKHIRIKGDPFKRTICVVRKRSTPMTEAAYHFYKMLRGTDEK